MEIMKIKGETKPKALTFPEWSADELALWTEKDESACVAWRESRSAKWEAGDEKLKASYPERAALDAGSTSSAPTRRTSRCGSGRAPPRRRRRRGGRRGLGARPWRSGRRGQRDAQRQDGARAPRQIMAKFREPATKEKLQAILKEIESMEDTVAASMAKMNKLLPTCRRCSGRASPSTASPRTS